MIKPDELRAMEFDVSVLGGYKRETVDSFFSALADDYEKLYNENIELVGKLKQCVEKIEEYQKDEKFLKTAIINAEKLNENSLREIEIREKKIITAAKETADGIIAQANSEAENIAKKARIDANEAIRACEIEAAEKISAINKAVEHENNKFNSIKKEVKEFKETIIMLYKSHLDSLSKIPDFVVEDEKKETVTENKAVIDKKQSETDSDTVKDNGYSVRQTNDQQTISGNTPSNKTDNEKTAEFVIDKKTKNDSNADEKDEANKKIKLQSIKFGTDFDVENDE